MNALNPPVWNKLRSRAAPGRAARGGAALVLLLLTLLPAAAEELRPLDLNAFLALVERNSLQLENVRTDRALAETQEKLVRSQIYPMIGARAGYTRNFLDIEQQFPVAADATQEIPGSFLGLDPGRNYYPLATRAIDVNRDNEFSLGLSVQQKLFDMSVFRALEASRQFTDLTGTIYEASRHEILTAAKRLFFQALLLQEVLDVRRSSREIAHDNYRATQRRLDSGLASPLELLRAEVNWKITEPETSQAERNLNVVLQNLRTFAGIPQGESIQLEGSLDRYPPLPSFEGAFAARADRPDYRALLGERRLRELNVGAERAKFFPTLAASLTYGWQTADDGFDLGNGTDVLTAGLTMTIPIFYGGSRFVQLEQAQLELRRTNTTIALQEESITTELETIRLTLEEAHLRIGSARQTMTTAERAYQVSETSLESGLATQLELKDARVSLEQARLNYLSAVFDYLHAYFDWQLATGRGDQGLQW
ncbi:MAG: TolC family protein [Spirochaetaceae bacterium]|nr:MAG: TolC family protein [Spirochaetaceae bacterium]